MFNFFVKILVFITGFPDKSKAKVLIKGCHE